MPTRRSWSCARRYSVVPSIVLIVGEKRSIYLRSRPDYREIVDEVALI